MAYLPVILFFTACMEYHYPGSPTQRGEEIYNTWNNSFQEFTFNYFGKVVLLNEVLQAPTPQQKDSLIKVYFGGYDRIQMYEDSTYVINIYDNNYYYDENFSYVDPICRMLVRTYGDDLMATGTKWTIVLNLPENFTYTPQTAPDGMQRMYSEPAPMETGFMYYPYYMPFDITNLGNGQFRFKDVEGAETLDYFSVDYLLTFNNREVVPGVIVTDRMQIEGKGRLSADMGRAIMDYQLTGYEIDKYGPKAGTVQITAIQRSTGEKREVKVECKSSGYTLTYEGVVTEYF